MDLHSAAREFYDLGITTDPAVSGGWELSVDAGATWVAGEAVTGGARWLVRGPSFTPDVGDVTVSTLVSASVQPLVRVVDTPETVVRDAPLIRLT